MDIRHNDTIEYDEIYKLLKPHMVTDDTNGVYTIISVFGFHSTELYGIGSNNGRQSVLLVAAVTPAKLRNFGIPVMRSRVQGFKQSWQSYCKLLAESLYILETDILCIIIPKTFTREQTRFMC